MRGLFKQFKVTEVVVLGFHVGVLVLSLLSSGVAFGEKAFTINGVTTTLKQVAEKEKAAFYEVEKRRYQLIEQLARQRYLEFFWQQQAAKSKKSIAQEKKDYFDKRVKLSKQQIDETMKRFKDHPQLSKLDDAKRAAEVKKFLRDSAERDLLNGIVTAALNDKKLRIDYPRPEEPTFDFTIRNNEPIKYGPADSDIKPVGCRGDDCITIVEFSEFQCPFCARVLPAAQEVMTTYKGKVRWVVRDFPLSFHNRAKPAAVAARCALKQDKYWQMYNTLFENQSKLSDKDFIAYAEQIKLDKAKWQACVDKPAAELAFIDQNMQSGIRAGVTGTPAFFINGRRLSGAVPFVRFKQIIDEELSKKQK